MRREGAVAGRVGRSWGAWGRACKCLASGRPQPRRRAARRATSSGPRPAPARGSKPVAGCKSPRVHPPGCCFHRGLGCACSAVDGSGAAPLWRVAVSPASGAPDQARQDAQSPGSCASLEVPRRECANPFLCVSTHRVETLARGSKPVAGCKSPRASPRAEQAGGIPGCGPRPGVRL